MNKTHLSNQPLKGTQDWQPDEYARSQFIFDSWQLFPETLGHNAAVYLPLLDADLAIPVYQLARTVRAAGINVVAGLDPQNVRQAVSLAHKRQFPWILLLGAAEYKTETVAVKNMRSGAQSQMPASDLIAFLRQNWE